jgi:hypothetical protein
VHGVRARKARAHRAGARRAGAHGAEVLMFGGACKACGWRQCLVSGLGQGTCVVM